MVTVGGQEAQMPFDGQDLDCVTLTSVAEELLAVKRYLQRHGWCQGSLRNDRRNVCLAEAMRSVGASTVTVLRLVRSIQALDGDHETTLRSNGLLAMTITRFNDLPTTDVHRVNEALDHAIQAEVG